MKGGDDERPAVTGPDRDDAGVSEAAATAVTSLAHETRLHTLLALWEADDRPLRFADLRRRVGVRDPGQFRYHLRKLEGRFVRRTDEGYDITGAGASVVWAIRSGDLLPATDAVTVETDDACSACGGALALRYADELLAVTCTACEEVYDMVAFHVAGLAGRTDEELLATFRRVLWSSLDLGAHDVCPRCYGAGRFDLLTDASEVPAWLRAALSPAELAELARFDPDAGDVTVTWTCSQCGVWMDFAVARLLAHRSAVAGFYRDHGVDVGAMASWVSSSPPGDVAVTVTGREPLSLVATVTLDDETLTVRADEGFATVTTARVPATEYP